MTAAGLAQSNGAADGTGTCGRNNGAAGVQGTTEFVKTGAGTLTLTGASSHTGGTVIQCGRLAVASDAALGAAYDGSLRVFRCIPGTGVYSNTDPPDAVLAGGAPAVAGGGTIETMGFDSTFSGNINGAGGLTLNGGGTVTVSGNNAHSGIVTVGLQFA